MSSTEVGVGHSVIVVTRSGSMEIPSEEIMKLRNETEVAWNSHFRSLQVNPYSRSRERTCLTWTIFSSRVSKKIRTSSR